jgi:hypothetical protein
MLATSSFQNEMNSGSRVGAEDGGDAGSMASAMAARANVHSQLRRVFEEGALFVTPVRGLVAGRGLSFEPHPPPLDDAEREAIETALAASTLTARVEQLRRERQRSVMHNTSPRNAPARWPADTEHWDATGLMTPDIFFPFPIPIPLLLPQPAVTSQGGEWAVRAVPAHEHAAPESLSEEQKQCSVCLDAMVAGAMVKTLPCAHTFHAACIDNWLIRRTTCPCCRVNIC